MIPAVTKGEFLSLRIRIIVFLAHLLAKRKCDVFSFKSFRRLIELTVPRSRDCKLEMTVYTCSDMFTFEVKK